eukprot:GFYU01000963.1.p1 GENE.GFYU01000963.1~~GFYU01000963.1.p1  ORF type:complete len:332 (+),score=87.04 GFYU01000963.1:63-998(+)
MGLQVVRTRAELKTLVSTAKQGDLPPGVDYHVGLVPTMGSLHAGHMQLIREARKRCKVVVASLFVNPAQFAPGEDFDQYPRSEESDFKMMSEEGTDVVFAPDVKTMYPHGRDGELGVQRGVFVDLRDVDTHTVEGKARPGFFRGVATVVTKLMNIVSPNAVFFGQKDGQQCIVINRMIEDLDFDIKLHVCPTVREAVGLAMSSRNVYLQPSDREAAPVVYKSLQAADSLWAEKKGQATADELKKVVSDVLATEKRFTLQYVGLSNRYDGADVDSIDDRDVKENGVMVSIAVKVGTTRLIDNILLEPSTTFA